MALVDLNETTCEKTEGKDMDYEAYTVVMAPNNKRILSVYAFSDLSAKRWLEEVLKSGKTQKSIVVGVSAAISNPSLVVRNPPFELLHISTGRNCLLLLVNGTSFGYTPKYLQTFFEDPRVVAVGVGMQSMAKKLREQHKIRIANAVEVKDENVVNAVKNLRVSNPDMYMRDSYWLKLTRERVIASTLDAYLCFSTGYDLISPKKKKGRD